MGLQDIYAIGRAIPLPTSMESVDRKLAFILFPYDAKAVINTSLAACASLLVLGVVLAPFSAFLSYIASFFSVLSGIVLYLYPTSILYGQRAGEYKEEMLRAVLRLSTFVSMETSLEYAFFETAEHLHGTLRLQFLDIKQMLRRKAVPTLGDAIAKYVSVWNEQNPIFVKSLRLLQTAELSAKEDRESILKEVTETLLLNYTTLGKRYTEELTNQSKKLVTIGVLFPILSLMLLPLLSVFLPDLLKMPMLAFVYIIFFPTITLLMALSFTAKRVQVDTVRIQDAAEYASPPTWYLWTAIGIGVVCTVPTLFFLSRVAAGTAGETETLGALIAGWLMGAGIMGGTYLYAFLYERRYRKLWNEVYEIEQDMPHLLQSFATYLTLNISTENVIPEIINDYESFGFADHPVVRAFRRIRHYLLTSKRSITRIVNQELQKLIPSKRVVEVISQIISFSEISQQSSARAAKMIREQTMGVYKLDDYIKTLLSETVSLINVTTTMLAPLLCAAAVIMSIAIVKSLTYITAQLEAIAVSFGAKAFSFQLVDTSKVIPPVFIEVVVSLYLVLIILILSFFATSINVGNDRYRLFKTIRGNVSGFVIYTVILFGGYIFIVNVLFKGVLGVG